jgi:hypothetical protein
LRFFTDQTLSLVYRQLLRCFECMEPQVSPRGLKCRELLDVMIEITKPDDSPIVTASAKRNAAIAKYTAAEFDLYARGEDSVEAFAEHAPFWRTVSDGETINSCYGKLLWYDQSLGENCHTCLGSGVVIGGVGPCFVCLGSGTHKKTPWEWAKQAILRDIDTRQAVAPIARPDHFRETKDLVCTSHLAFRARGGKLHLTAVMRSNDLVRGFVYDAPWFVHCLFRMQRELSDAGCSLHVGRYTHIAHSLHVYEADMPLLSEMQR